MARISNEQKQIRMKALKESINDLKEQSAVTKNLVTFDRVAELANETYKEQLVGNISATSIKTPTSKEFKAIKKLIVDYREEHKKIKSVASKKSKSNISSLNTTIGNLMIEVAKHYDEKLELFERIKSLEYMLEKAKNERDEYRDKLNALKAKSGNQNY